MLAENVAAACLAPFAMTVRRFVVTPNVFCPLGDLHRLWFPQGEGIDRPCRPVPARLAMAVTHGFRLTVHGEPDCTAKTAAFVSFSIACHIHSYVVVRNRLFRVLQVLFAMSLQSVFSDPDSAATLGSSALSVYG
jgi:hypothetical protein